METRSSEVGERSALAGPKGGVAGLLGGLEPRGRALPKPSRGVWPPESGILKAGVLRDEPSPRGVLPSECEEGCRTGVSLAADSGWAFHR